MVSINTKNKPDNRATRKRSVFPFPQSFFFLGVSSFWPDILRDNSSTIYFSADGVRNGSFGTGNPSCGDDPVPAVRPIPQRRGDSIVVVHLYHLLQCSLWSALATRERTQQDLQEGGATLAIQTTQTAPIILDLSSVLCAGDTHRMEFV